MPVPDFDSAKGYYWMKQVKAARADNWRIPNRLPRKPRRTAKERDFFAQVDRRLNRLTFSPGISFDKDGKIIREVENESV